MKAIEGLAKFTNEENYEKQVERNGLTQLEAFRLWQLIRDAKTESKK